MASAFDEFVKRKTHKADPIDWSERQEKWLGKLGELHASIKVYLNEFTKSGAIQMSTRKVKLHEEHLGSYEADTMMIAIGDSTVELRPKGTLLIGGIGRADLIGRNAEVMLVLTPKEAQSPQMRIRISNDDEHGKEGKLNWDDWVWKIAMRQPTLRYIDLDQQSFQDALMMTAD